MMFFLQGFQSMLRRIELIWGKLKCQKTREASVDEALRERIKLLQARPPPRGLDRTKKLPMWIANINVTVEAGGTLMAELCKPIRLFLTWILAFFVEFCSGQNSLFFSVVVNYCCNFFY